MAGHAEHVEGKVDESEIEHDAREDHGDEAHWIGYQLRDFHILGYQLALPYGSWGTVPLVFG